MLAIVKAALAQVDYPRLGDFCSNLAAFRNNQLEHLARNQPKANGPY